MVAYLAFFVLSAFKVSTSQDFAKINEESSYNEYSVEFISLKSVDNKLCYKPPFQYENLLHILFFEGNEREEKEERNDFESLFHSQFQALVNGVYSKFLVASVKSYKLSIDNRFVIPLYDFQHSWKTHCII